MPTDRWTKIAEEITELAKNGLERAFDEGGLAGDISLALAQAFQAGREEGGHDVMNRLRIAYRDFVKADLAAYLLDEGQSALDAIRKEKV